MIRNVRIAAMMAFAFGALAVTPGFARTQQDGWDVCPSPSEALSDVPAQLDQLQADIDRFTLCLNRAELLMKLDDLKSQNAGGANLAMNLPGAMTPAPLTPEQTSQLLADSAAVAVAGSPAVPAATPAPDTFVVRDIRGVGADLVARVQGPDGEFETVKIGDRLADGSEVTAITVTQVTVSEKGKARRLEWQ